MDKIGQRFNEGKLRWRNVPMFLLRGLIQVGQFGEKKYATYNYLKGLSVNDCLDCAMRHIDSSTDPLEDQYNDESRVHNLYHAAWNLIVAAWMIENRPDLDDRLKIEQLNLKQ